MAVVNYCYWNKRFQYRNNYISLLATAVLLINPLFKVGLLQISSGGRYSGDFEVI